MRTPPDLRAHLAALVAGSAPGKADAPSPDALDVGAAIAACVEASAISPFDSTNEPALAPSALLPVLP